MKPARFFSTRAIFAVVALAGGLVAVAQPASAAPQPKTTICHHTSSETNPFVEVTVADKSLAKHALHGDAIPAPATGCDDICPNIPGHQLEVPAGLVLDANGDCVPIDVCPNLPGDQAEVPDGYIVDANGDCVPEPQPCNETTVSGGEGITVTNHELGQTGGSFQFDYDTVIQPDQITIRYEGNIIFDVGPIGTGGTVTTTVNYGPGTSTQIEITVDGVEAGTVWSYTVHCPTNT